MNCIYVHMLSRIVSVLETQNVRIINSDDRVNKSPGEMGISHCFTDIDARRTLVEFVKCFLSGYIACGCKPTSYSVAVAIDLAESLNLYPMFNHVTETVCTDCRKKLLLGGYAAEEVLYSVGNLARAISSAPLNCDRVILKVLESNISSAIKSSIPRCYKYRSLFEEHQNHCVRMYKANSKRVTDWKILKCKQIIGRTTNRDLFKVRAQVTPLVNFRNSCSKECSLF